MFHVIHSRRMPKYQTGTSLEAEVMARIKLIAQVDRRSVADVAALPGSYGTSTTNRFFRVRTVRP
jgi:hypothetical protein